MNKRLALIFAATSLASASALAQEQGAAPAEDATAALAEDAAATSAPLPEAKAFLRESCAARKFETTVEMTVDGVKRGKKVTLCGQEGQSDADWVGTLKDAIVKVEANQAMAEAVKGQIITALKAEIARLDVAPASSGSTNAALTGLPLEIISPSERLPEYSTLPPLPAAKSAAKLNLAGTAAAPAVKTPRLTIRCSVPGEPGGAGTCTWFERNTMLTIRADEDLAEGTSLRFVRSGDIRGEIALEQLRQGQSLRSKLPSRVCSGVLKGKAQIQVVARDGKGSGQVVDTLGPFSLRCRA